MSSAPSDAAASTAPAPGHHELVFRQAPVGVLTYDRELVIDEVNAALCEILRSPEDRLVGLDMHRLRDHRILPSLRRALTGDNATYEGPYFATTSRAHLWIRMQTAPLRDLDGVIRRAVAIVEDITARKTSEDQRETMLELSEAAHRAEDLPALYAEIHAILARRMPAENLYFALWDPRTRTVRFPYFVDRNDPPPPPQKARRGLTERVLFGGRPVLADREDLEALTRDGEIEVGGSLPASWLGVPLVVDEEPVGVLVLQSYEDHLVFDEQDASLLGFVAEQVAMAIVRKRHEEEIEYLASFDALTDLRNRRTLQDQAPEVLALADRKGWDAALLYLDLDRFKSVNDTLGHDAGDELLVEVARELASTHRQSDLLARIGGDEFALLLPDAGPETAVRTAERILRLFDRRFEVRGHPIHLGGSIGIAVFPEHGRTLEELLKHADIAMYRAKDQQSGWAIYDEASSPFSRFRLAREAALKEAIDTDALTLVYQPIRAVQSGEVSAVEALVRWTLDGRPQSAGEFIPLAEACGLVQRLDRRVLRRALREMTSLPNLQVSVNMSARTLRSPDLLPALENALHETSFDPRRLIVEVTESVVISAFDGPARILEELRSLGVGIAIDDFGSGFASLTYLRHLPCDRLKIDRSLVADIGHDARSEALVRAVIQLGHGLGLTVVAEGVERTAQLHWLDDAGVDELQGFLVGAPTTIDVLRVSGAPTLRGR